MSNSITPTDRQSGLDPSIRSSGNSCSADLRDLKTQHQVKTRLRTSLLLTEGQIANEIGARNWPKFLFTLAISAVLLTASFVIASAAEKNVLFIHTSRSNGAGAIIFDRTFQALLTAGSSDRINLYNEYSDLWRFQGEDYQSALREFYRNKYGTQKIDLIVADSPPAIRFLIKFGEELFPGTPVVFCVAEQTLVQGLSLPKNMTGAMTSLEFGKTVEAALRLQPDTRKIIVIAGTSPLDKNYLSSAQEEFRKFESQVEFEYLSDLPISEIEKKVSQLPAHTIVYGLPFYRDGAGHSFTPVEAADRVARAANAPFYSIAEVFLSNGVGGYAWSVEADAAETAKISLRILAGERAENIPPYVGPTNRYIFDWRQLSRWGIPEERLPAGSILRNKELSFWQKYRWYLVGIAAVTIAETLLIVFLLLQRIKRARAEDDLRVSEERFLKAFRASPDALSIIRASDGLFIDINKSFENLFGFDRNEVIGHTSIELGIYSDVADREVFRSVLERQGGTRDYEINLKNRSGSIRNASVSSEVIDIKGEQCVIAIIRDITESKQAQESLRESEERNSAILQAIPDLMFLQNRDGVYLDFHAAEPELLLVPPSAFLGKNMREVLPGKLADDLFRTFRRAEDTGETQSVEYFLPINGRDLWFEARIVKTEGDKFLSVIRDVTLRKGAEEALRESEGRFRMMANTAPVMVWMSSVDKLCTFFNRSWLEFTGRTLEEELGNGWTKGVHSDDYERCLDVYSSSFDERKNFRMEYRLRRFDGEYRWVLDEGVPRYTPDGNFAGYIGCCIDFTERRIAEEALRNALVEVGKLKDQLQQENIYLREQVRLDYEFQEIVGESDEIKYVLFKIQQVAPTDATVLILGETGTGKELVARAIHGASGRKDKPMVKINCAALPSSLIESELFGHEKGAFTGAQARKIGRFEVADGATLFLDEIGELPIELQSKLLRVLQEGEFERLGSSQTTKVDVRIIAATNRNLKAEVRNGLFREDLWYRLNVFPITVPPLRQRKPDISPLVSFFVNQFNRKLGRFVKTIAPQTLQALENYSWPGNVRELANVVESALINSNGTILQLTDTLESEPVPSRDGRLGEKRLTALDDVEREHILAILNMCDWRIEGQNGAAQLLGINSSTLRSRMNKLGIRRPKSSAAMQTYKS